MGSLRARRGWAPRVSCVWALLVVCSALLPSKAVLGFEYGVEGRVSYKVLRRSGDVFAHQEDMFRAEVSNCWWRIQTLCFKNTLLGQNEPVLPPMFYSSDTTNFYELMDVAAIETNAMRAGTKIHGGKIGPGAVPFAIDTKVIVLWYAFASGCYFRSLDEPFLNPPVPLDKSEEYANDFRVRGVWELNGAQPFLPSSIAFDRTPKHQLPTGTASEQSWAFTNCVYSANNFRAVAECAVPTLAVWEYFSRNVTGAQEPILTGRIEILVTNVFQQIGAVAFRPRVVGPVMLSELRTISERTPFTLIVDNSTNWPQLENSLARANTIATVTRRERTHRGFLVGMLCLLLAAPLVAVLRRRKKG